MPTVYDLDEVADLLHRAADEKRDAAKAAYGAARSTALEEEREYRDAAASVRAHEARCDVDITVPVVVSDALINRMREAEGLELDEPAAAATACLQEA